MATGYRIGGADLDELYEMPNITDLTNTKGREESKFVTSGRFLKNGQSIRTALNKTIFRGSSYSFTQIYRLDGENLLMLEKGKAPFGYLLATLGPGNHQMTESDGKVYLDGEELPYAPLADNLLIILSAAGGGGAGSALLYCSAGGGGGASAIINRKPHATTKHRGYPISFSIGTGGEGGNGGENGQAGGNTSVAGTNLDLTLGGGGGGSIDDGDGGSGGTALSDDFDTIYFVDGGAGGKKENNGNASTVGILGLGLLDYYAKDYPQVQEHVGGVSSGNNYGGGGGASGLADGAAANSNASGVAGTLGAGGSGAGYTAFQRSAGGKGGDGVVYIYY